MEYYIFIASIITSIVSFILVAQMFPIQKEMEARQKNMEKDIKTILKKIDEFHKFDEKI